MQNGDTIELAYVVERDVDHAFVQLVHSSADFREWFVEEIGEAGAANQFEGVKHSVMTENGESDVEIALVSTAGERVRVLVENKINASKQDRQFERYYERGERYVERGACDRFCVCLLAPEGYASESDRQSVDHVISYEEMLETIDALDPDGREFCSQVITEALRKPSGTDHSALTLEVSKRFAAFEDLLPDVYVSTVSPTQVVVKSNDPDHPASTYYKVYIPGIYEGCTAIVRIEIDGESTAEERAVIQSVLADHIAALHGFELTGNIMDAVRTSVDVADGEAIDDHYLDSIVSNLCDLIAYYHPKLVEEAAIPSESGS